MQVNTREKVKDETFTDAMEIMREHYRKMEERALAQKKCITCKHRVPGRPFDPNPPQCELGGEATHTCSLYRLREEQESEKDGREKL